MQDREYHDGRQDGLTPLESIDLSRVHSFADLLRAMAKSAFSGRQLGEAFEIVLEMTRDPDCLVVLTLSGAMTVAKQGRIICEMVDRGLVHVIVSTGALVAHGLTESVGLIHYRYDPSLPDETLFRWGYNRIYDTLEMEANLDDIERLVRSVLDEEEPEGGVWSSASLCRAIGKRLKELDRGPGILRSAYEKNVPVFIPALTDSELGLDFATWAMQRHVEKGGREEDVFDVVPPFNPFLDLQHFSKLIKAAKRTGIITLGGGVPRNWAQQVAPYVDLVAKRFGKREPVPKYRYGVRICPEPVHWGGLSGCTYSEGVSWGKFVSPNEGGRFAEVYADATVAFPLLMKAVFEELDRDESAGT